MQTASLNTLIDSVSQITPLQTIGRVQSVDGHVIRLTGLEDHVRLGDRLRLQRHDNTCVEGEVLRIERDCVTMLPDRPPHHVALDNRVLNLGPAFIAPNSSWIGRVIDPFGRALDSKGPLKTSEKLDVNSDPPPPVHRKGLGPRLDTGLHVFNTMLPIVKGQRIGIFAGSGVGKSTLLAKLMQTIDADVVVLALVGERGREIRDFVQDVLGERGLARTVVVAASADTASTARARCPMTAMRVAEYFRDQGKHVLLIVDSVTRFAEAHREVAIAAGEFPSLRGFPASTPSKIMGFVERAGPGAVGGGDITAVFSVLVAGSDMEEPVADMMRGVLDGHVVLDREIAEKGRFPAINVLQSISRSLPTAASKTENHLLQCARRLASVYEESAAMVRAGLYASGSDPILDQAIAFDQHFQEFLSGETTNSAESSFDHLRLALRRSGLLIE